MNFNQLNEPQSPDSSREYSKSKERKLLKRNEDEIHYFEYGAHFPYQTVYHKLENYLASITNVNTCENDPKKRKANIFNISIYDKSRNINLNNNIRQNNMHFNNPKKGITLLLFNKSNVTMQNINPINNNNINNNNDKNHNNNNKDANNVSRRKGAINNNRPKAKIKNLIHQKEVIGKKSARIAYSTSHPKKKIPNYNSKKEDLAPLTKKCSKSNPVPYKRNINTNSAQAFVNIQMNNNINNIKKVKETHLSKKQLNTTKKKMHNNSNQYSISSKDKDKKPNSHSANEKLKSNNTTNRNNNIIILSTAKNQFKLIERKPIGNRKKTGNTKDDKSRNNDNDNNQNSNDKRESIGKNKEKETNNSKQSMTFNNINQQNQEKQKERPSNSSQNKDICQKPRSSEKPMVIPQMKDVKFINLNTRKTPEHYYSLSRKHVEVKVNLTTNQNSPSVSKGKMIHHNTNINVDLSTKISSISKYSSRNFSSNKPSIKSTTAKPVLTTKQTNDKEKLIKKLIIRNQETFNSEMKVSPIITTSNQSPSNLNQQFNNNKVNVDLNSKNRIKSNSIPTKEGKVHVKSITSKQSFIQCGVNGKKNNFNAKMKKKK